MKTLDEVAFSGGVYWIDNPNYLKTNNHWWSNSPYNHYTVSEYNNTHMWMIYASGLISNAPGFNARGIRPVIFFI